MGLIYIPQCNMRWEPQQPWACDYLSFHASWSSLLVCKVEGGIHPNFIQIRVGKRTASQATLSCCVTISLTSTLCYFELRWVGDILCIFNALVSWAWTVNTTNDSLLAPAMNVSWEHVTYSNYLARQVVVQHKLKIIIAAPVCKPVNMHTSVWACPPLCLWNFLLARLWVWRWERETGKGYVSKFSPGFDQSFPGKHLLQFW